VSQSLEIPDIDKSWTIFLDRDGVINERIMGHYITKVEDFKFLPGVIDAIGIFNKLFFKTIIVTNQAGVGKRFMSQKVFFG
jgi:histidinol phosphatase-like enzyme